MEVWFSLPTGGDTVRTQPDQLEHDRAAAPQIYRMIRARIVSTELMPGTLLSESEVAATYAISRQPVREAFIRLAAAGLVRIRPQRGTFVTEISEAAVLDARFVREAIEVEIVRLVAAEGNPNLVRDLRDQLAAQRAASPGDSPAFLRLDEAFHRTLADAAGKSYAWSVVEEVKAQMDRVRYLSFHPMHTALLIDQHEGVVDAIAARDPAAAESVMRRHLREIIKSLAELATDRPELFGHHATRTPQGRKENATA
jgi:GntR family transcriptional regulator, rspAB operon transcriptional repressor